MKLLTVDKLNELDNQYLKMLQLPKDKHLPRHLRMSDDLRQ